MKMTVEYMPTICPYGSCGCGIDLVVKDGRIIGQEPREGQTVLKTRMPMTFCMAKTG